MELSANAHKVLQARYLLRDELARLIRSMKIRPGSPVAQALATISANTSLAPRLATPLPERGLMTAERKPRVSY